MSALPSASHTETQSAAGQWLLVAVATACGFTAAYNIGKVPPSVPALRDEFATSLTWIAALVSSYSLVAMTCSLVMGRVVGWLGMWRSTALGLSFLIAGGLAGAVTHQFGILLAGRVIEGLGYLAIAVTMPGFIARVCSDSSRPLAMGVWGTFVPGGITLCMLAAPWLSAIGGWRSLWWVGVAVAVVMLLVALVIIRPVTVGVAQSAGTEKLHWRSVINKTTLLMSGCFAVYSMSFTGLATFLPTYWSEVSGLSLPVATKFAALVIATNIVGNLAGGWLNKRGILFRHLIAIGVPVSALCGMAVYATSMSFTVQLPAAMMFSFLGGIAPSTMFSSVAKVAATPAQSGLLVGLLFQGAGCGQVVGPLLFGAIIDYSGSWAAAPLYFLVCAAIGTVLMWRLPGTLTRQS